MFYLVVLVTLLGMAAGVFDKQLHDKYMTMPRSEFIKHFNKQNFSWKMFDYGEDFYRKYRGCSHINREKFMKLPLRTHGPEIIKDLPENFDSRQKWPQCETLNEILDQGACGSCWTFGTATPASDRMCIHKNLHVRLSEQDLECSQENVCRGGDPLHAFEFWRDSGLVTQECKPYDVEELKKNGCKKECVDSSINYAQDKHYADNIYRISSESDQIKAELVTNGPIQAAFTMYEDFKQYNGGVYEHKTGDIPEGHSVRVVGYGVEDGKNYWLLANSWNSTWGENGWGKFKSYQIDLGFEDALVSGMPKN